MKARPNIGTPDRIVRIALGVGLLTLVPAAAVGYLSAWAFIGLIGAIPLVAGITGYCPPYAWLGINTLQEEGCQG